MLVEVRCTIFDDMLIIHKDFVVFGVLDRLMLIFALSLIKKNRNVLPTLSWTYIFLTATHQYCNKLMLSKKLAAMNLKFLIDSSIGPQLIVMGRGSIYTFIIAKETIYQIIRHTATQLLVLYSIL